MEIVKKEETQVVLVAGQQLQMATSRIQSLPMIVKREILYPKLCKKEAISERQKTVARLISLLGVNFSDEQEKQLSTAEFGSFLKGYALTSAEVLEAYRMAIRKEFDYKVYPTLSVIQCGEILNLYQEFKRNSALRDRVMRNLKRTKPKEPTEEELRKQDLAFRERVFREVNQTKFSDAAFILYDEFNKKGLLRKWDNKTKKRFFDHVQKKYLEKQEERRKSGLIKKTVYADLLRRSSEDLGEVKSLYKSILVSDYITRFYKEKNLKNK